MLAEIDTPELDERLAQAREELSRAKAALALAQVTAGRWAALRNSSAVSKQSADEKSSDEKVKEADVGAASANLDRLKAQKLFAQILAPFDGVVTARNIDIGSYVAPDRGAEPLFKVADIHAVRIYVNVPQIYSSRLARGMKATFTTPQWPDEVFNATITTTSNAIGAQTGSLLVELDRPMTTARFFPAPMPMCISSCRSTPRNCAFPPARCRSARRARGWPPSTRTTASTSRRSRSPRISARKSPSPAGFLQQDRVVDNPAETLVDGDKVRIGGAAVAPSNPQRQGLSRLTSSRAGFGAKAFFAGALAGLAGCDFAPNYMAPETAVPAITRPRRRPAPTRRRRKTGGRRFQSAELDRLEARVEADNPDYAAALARYDRAKAVLDLAQSAFYPQVVGQPALSFNKQSQHRPLRSANQPTYYGGNQLLGGLTWEAGHLGPHPRPGRRRQGRRAVQ